MKTRTMREFIAERPEPGFYWVNIQFLNQLDVRGWEPALLEVHLDYSPSSQYTFELLSSDQGYGRDRHELDECLVGDKIEVPK